MDLRLDDHNLLEGLAELRWGLDDLIADRRPVLVVDLSGLSRLSSATLAGLLWTQRRCRARGGYVVLRGPNRRCRELLARTGLAGLFTQDDDPAAAEQPSWRGAALVGGG